MALRDLLLAEPDRSKWAAIKCREIAKDTPSLARTSRQGNIDIELVEVKDIGNGVLEVFVREWSGNRQVGFGPDGSVDMERILIHSPRYCVPDPLGPIVKTFSSEGPHEITEKRYREDMREALLRDITHTLSVKKQRFVGSRNIVPGKRGNSTATFFSSAGDGFVTNESSTNWNTVHDATDGGSADAVGTFARCRVGANASAQFVISRCFFPFAISGLGTVSSATCSLDTVDANLNEDNDGDDFFVFVGATTQADPATVGTADYDTCGSVNSPTEWSDRIDWSSIASAGTYTDWTINATGLAAIVNGTNWLAGMREGHDVIDSQFTGAANKFNQKRFETSETTDTTSDPKLVVEHSAGGRTTFNTRSWNLGVEIGMGHRMNV